jgi:1-deoxy-D-xylulose-5-phosphate reductoisomerase
MRVPIAYGLSWPERIESGADALDYAKLGSMSFEAPERARFPGLFLAWDALNAAEGTCAVLNAANEIAVAAFLDQKIRFDQIHQVNTETLQTIAPSKPQNLADLLGLDDISRRAASEVVKGLLC